MITNPSEDGFGTEAVWRGAWCDVGECLGRFLFYRERGTVHSARFLPAHPLAIPNFLLLYPPRIQHECLPVHSWPSVSYSRSDTLNPFRTAVPFWGQTRQISSSLSPNRDCGLKRDSQVSAVAYCTHTVYTTNNTLLVSFSPCSHGKKIRASRPRDILICTR